MHKLTVTDREMEMLRKTHIQVEMLDRQWDVYSSATWAMRTLMEDQLKITDEEARIDVLRWWDEDWSAGVDEVKAIAKFLYKLGQRGDDAGKDVRTFAQMRMVAELLALGDLRTLKATGDKLEECFGEWF